MTAYHGGKQRIGKQLAEIIYDESMDIEEESDFTIKGYCEPFAGMLGVYQYIPELFEEHSPPLKYKAGDINRSVVMMWKQAQKGWRPPTTATQDLYDRLKNSKDSALKGYVGHQYSFGGQFFNGYAPKYGKTKNSSKASNNIHKIATDLRDVSITCGSFTQFSNLKNYIIYCDPPYDNTIKRYYKNGDILQFDHDLLWDWCRYMADDNIVFISGYKAPRDFQCIFSSSHKLTGISSGRNNKKRVEKLFLMY